jgi:energy-coupling factor transporter ATP-binding protein EcfA2
VQVVVITGAPGAGKTSVLTALIGLLEADDVRFAAVEVEALALVHPWPDDDTAFDHLAYVAESFRRRGYPCLLVTATIVSPEYLRRLRDAVRSDDVRLVRLAAPPALLRERITRREPPEWVGLPRLLEAAETLATAIAALPGIDLVLHTEDVEARIVAAALRDALHLNMKGSDP